MFVLGIWSEFTWSSHLKRFQKPFIPQYRLGSPFCPKSLMQTGPHFFNKLCHITIVFFFFSQEQIGVLSEGETQQIQIANSTEKEGRSDRRNASKHLPLLSYSYCSRSKEFFAHKQIFLGRRKLDPFFQALSPVSSYRIRPKVFQLFIVSLQ